MATEFTCSNGHKFTAIAKLRSRCPSCGIMTRRSFSTLGTKETSSGSPSKPTGEVPADDSRTTSQPSFRKAERRKDTASGSKNDSSSTKVSESSSRTKSTPESTTPKPRAQIIKQGLPKVAKPTTSSTNRSVAKPPPPKKGPVKRVTARAGHAPTVTKPPTGSKERKVLEQTTDEPYWKKVKRTYFR